MTLGYLQCYGINSGVGTGKYRQVRDRLRSIGDVVAGKALLEKNKTIVGLIYSRLFVHYDIDTFYWHGSS